MRSDCEKRNTAQLCGWDVYEFVPEAITSMEALNIIKEAGVFYKMELDRRTAK